MHDTRLGLGAVKYDVEILAFLICETVLELFIANGEVEFPNMSPLAVDQEVADEDFTRALSQSATSKVGLYQMNLPSNSKPK